VRIVGSAFEFFSCSTLKVLLASDRARIRVKSVPNQERQTAFRFRTWGGKRRGAGADFRLVHYSLQGSHAHFLVEADDARALARGMQGLKVRVAKALNRLMSRRGKVFADHAASWRDPFASENAPATAPRSWLLRDAGAFG
jgi:hypothetical protein